MQFEKAVKYMPEVLLHLVPGNISTHTRKEKGERDENEIWKRKGKKKKKKEIKKAAEWGGKTRDKNQVKHEHWDMTSSNLIHKQQGVPEL